jgi:hypothetical protein
LLGSTPGNSQLPLDWIRPYASLSDKLAYRRNRPAVDRRVRKYITVPLGQAFGKKAIDHGDVVEVRMVCGPSFEQVDRVEMHLLIDDAKDIERITRQYEAFEATLQLPADLKLLPPKVVPYDIYPYAISKGSAFVDYTDLSD